jgi:transposase-like protein
MHNYFRRQGTYQGLFDKYPNIINKQVSQHLENIYRQYKKHEARKRELTFAEKAKDRAWKITRKPLNDSLKYQPIKLETITNYLRI